MTLFELQAWLGHRTEHHQHYAKITPNTLSRPTPRPATSRNVRTIEVLVDRDAVTSGAPPPANPGSTTTSATAGAPTASSNNARTGWLAPVAISTPPKGSTKAQLLEARTTSQRMRATIPLTDEERNAVDDGHAALDALLNRLATSHSRWTHTT